MSWVDDYKNRAENGELPSSELNPGNTVYENKVAKFEKSCAENGIVRSYNLLRALFTSHSSLQADLQGALGSLLVDHIHNGRIICIDGNDSFRKNIVALWCCWQAISLDMARYFVWINSQRVGGPLEHDDAYELAPILVMAYAELESYSYDSLLVVEDLLLLRYEALRPTVLVMADEGSLEAIQNVTDRSFSSKLCYVNLDDGTWG